MYLCERHAEEVMGHVQQLGLRVSSFRGDVLALLEPVGEGEDGPLENVC